QADENQGTIAEASQTATEDELWRRRRCILEGRQYAHMSHHPGKRRRRSLVRRPLGASTRVQLQCQGGVAEQKAHVEVVVVQRCKPSIIDFLELCLIEFQHASQVLVRASRCWQSLLQERLVELAQGVAASAQGMIVLNRLSR